MRIGQALKLNPRHITEPRLNCASRFPLATVPNIWFYGPELAGKNLDLIVV
jgi:hypothetical protein